MMIYFKNSNRNTFQVVYIGELWHQHSDKIKFVIVWSHWATGGFQIRRWISKGNILSLICKSKPLFSKATVFS